MLRVTGEVTHQAQRRDPRAVGHPRWPLGGGSCELGLGGAEEFGSMERVARGKVQEAGTRSSEEEELNYWGGLVSRGTGRKRPG